MARSRVRVRRARSIWVGEKTKPSSVGYRFRLWIGSSLPVSRQASTHYKFEGANHYLGGQVGDLPYYAAAVLWR